MNDEDFLAAAIDQLSEETRAAATACAAAQMNLSRRITPGECMAVADAMGAPRSPVLALLGWISSTADRPNRRAFFDVLVPRGEPRWPTDRETVMALAVCRTLQ